MLQEHKAVGPNLKTYYYYTNAASTKEDLKGVIIIATGQEGTGSVYDEVGDYLSDKGYAMYAIDELGYGKTGKVVEKTGYKNWKRKHSYWAAYNIHSLATIAKREHPNTKICIVGNDFGSMLTLEAVKEFPEVADKVVTIGWGTPRGEDFWALFTSYIRKLFLFDDNTCKGAHFRKNLRLAIRFENDNKYAWLTSDKDQLKKIRDAGFLDTPGTVGHYFYYFARKIRVPYLMNHKRSNKQTSMLFISGKDDLSTLHGRKTKALASFYRRKKFANVDSLIVEGRHQVLFDTNRFAVIDNILSWMESGALVMESTPEVTLPPEKKNEEAEELKLTVENSTTITADTEEVEVLNKENKNVEIFREADDDDELRINARK